MSSTDLGSIIGNTQCGNFRIFLLSRFYVKLILVILKPQKLLFRPFEQLSILNFWELLTFSSVKFLKTQHSSPPWLVKQQILTLWNQPKLISPKFRVAGNCKISTLWNIHNQNYQLGCPGLYRVWKTDNMKNFVKSTQK